MAEVPNNVTYFAQTNSRGKEVTFGIKRNDRRRHMYVIGKTGVGKSTLLENLAIQDIRNGEGIAFIDPHGGTADKLLEYVPEHRIKDVIYFAPFDMENPIAFNVMEDVGYDKRHLVVSGLMSAFQKLWVDAWSARMEYILSNAILALLEYPDATLLDVNTMLINKGFRQKVVDNVKDPLVKKFWAEEFAGYSERYAQEATPAIQNKIGQFTNNPLIRNIVGQPKSSFDLRQAMDEKKIVIINLSKGRVGDVNARLLGSILVTKIYLAAMSRADVHATTLADLPDFYFYVDEFQNFANKSFADILAEARKYKLNLVIAHQYVEQMEEEVRNAVFGNVGTTIAFRVGPFDAEILETLFQPQFLAADLVNLGMGQTYLSLMIDGIGSQPFSAQTLMPFSQPPQMFVDEIIESSRKQFGQPRAEVEAAIEKWQATEAPPEPPKKPRAKPTSYGAPSASYGASSAAPRSSYAPVHSAPAASAPASASIARPSTPTPTPTPPSPAVPSAQVVAPPPLVSAPVSARPPLTHAPAAPHRQHQPHRVHLPQHKRVEREEAPNNRPALEGTGSLREALAALGKGAPPSAPASPEARPAPAPHPVRVHDLKAALGQIAPAAAATARPAPERHPAEKLPLAAPEVPQRPQQPAGMPQDKLRDMLKVDDVDQA